MFPSVTHYALCQDCLKVHKGSLSHIHSLASEDVMCDNCGGQVCDCSGCVESALEIERVGVDSHVLANPGLFNPAFVQSVRERQPKAA
jgi:hypothetical protein